MNTNSEIGKIFAKYTLLLAILYAIQYLMEYGLRFYKLSETISNSNILKMSFIGIGVVIVGNLITLWFVLKDKKEFQIENRYLGILTFCFRPLGVCILLIQIIMKNKENEIEEDTAIDSN